MSAVLPGFTRRDCPICGASARTQLLRLDRDSIFRSNWSYRTQAKPLLPIGDQDIFPLDQCDACGFIYASLLPDMGFLQAIYDRVIDPDLARRNNLSAAEMASKMANLSTLLRTTGQRAQPLRVLDYGCGFGAALALLAAAGGAVQAVGYETSEARLADLHARGLAASGDLGEIEAQGPYNAVILDNVLEHVPEPRTTLAFVRRVSAADAVLFVSVPQAQRRRIVAQQIACNAQRAIDMDINPWEHLNYFNLKHLDSLLAEADFYPLPAATLPEPVDIGLRSSASIVARLKNGLASVLRLAAYVIQGDALPRTTRRFYRRAGMQESA